MILRKRKQANPHAHELGIVVEIAANLNGIPYELERNGALLVDDVEDALHVVHERNVVLAPTLPPSLHEKN